MMFDSFVYALAGHRVLGAGPDVHHVHHSREGQSMDVNGFCMFHSNCPEQFRNPCLSCTSGPGGSIHRASSKLHGNRSRVL